MVATSEPPSVKDTYLNPLAAAKLLTSPTAGARAMRVPPPTRSGLGSTLESKAGRFRKGNPISQEASSAFAYTSRTPPGTRTLNPWIKSPMLCQLS